MEAVVLYREWAWWALPRHIQNKGIGIPFLFTFTPASPQNPNGNLTVPKNIPLSAFRWAPAQPGAFLIPCSAPRAPLRPLGREGPALS